MFTDGRSAEPESTKEAAAAARADGINLISVGVKNADYNELVAIAGDQSRVYTIDDFDKLAELAPNIKETTCRIVEEGGEIRSKWIWGLWFCEHVMLIPEILLLGRRLTMISLEGRSWHLKSPAPRMYVQCTSC